jgi:peptidyl-tRNA hydrolase, PTH1 family
VLRGGPTAFAARDLLMGESLKLIVGLGNPGTEYARTRHNAGFQFVEELARRAGSTFRSEPRHRAELARASIAGHDAWLLKPMSYMNRSGDPVQSVASFYKVPVQSILVAYDELDFPAGVVRLKLGGGAGGHNGMRDVISHVGEQFWRLRIGIGHPGDRAQVLDYVLGRPNASDSALLENAIQAAADSVPVLLGDGAQIAMNRLHGRDPPGNPAAPTH